MALTSDPAGFRVAVAREAAHAAVAEHFGMEVQRLELDWRGFPVCHYSGGVAGELPAHEVNQIILLAGLVGARLEAKTDWRTPAGDVSGWLDELEFDPNDSPDSAYQGDLVLALRAVGGEVEKLQALEAKAYALLSADPVVEARWKQLAGELLRLGGEPLPEE